MISFIRSNSDDEDFINLIHQLDDDLNQRNGAVQNEYNRFNIIKSIDTVLIAYAGKIPVGCGCFKQYDNDTVEIKRMFVKPENRGMGIAKTLLSGLEKWASELGYTKSILETGINQLEAIELYKKSGYTRIENYGLYIGMSNSVCFGKDLKSI